MREWVESRREGEGGPECQMRRSRVSDGRCLGVHKERGDVWTHSCGPP